MKLKEMLNYDAVNEFRRRALNPDHPVTRGSAENPDIYSIIIQTPPDTLDIFRYLMRIREDE